jgi:glycosidase
MILAVLSLLQNPLTVDHAFIYHASQVLEKVNIAGSFNGWNKDVDEMSRSSDGMTWTKHFKLTPGSYTYKFVLNGSQWITDPNAKSVDDGNGNTNSQLIILPAGYKKPAKKGDGIITEKALKHLIEVPYFNWDRGILTLSIQARPDDIASIKVKVEGKGEFKAEDAGGDDLYERYTAKIPWNRKQDLRYQFILNDGAGSLSFGPKGLTKIEAGNEFSVKAASYKPFEVPTWVEHSVIYHIFPDRFANGDKSNDPSGVLPWDSSKLTYSSYLGGDVAGVEQHRDYLKSLGFSAVFFNPIFKSPVYHRYETTDYHEIDPYFGTNAEFEKMTHDLKKDGMRVILDGVFNHTATDFFPFADVVKNGANSRYTDWYTFHSFPVKIGPNPNYVAWFNYPSLPKVNYSSAAATAYMLDVPAFWSKRADIEGWRLDAANEVTMDYWRAFRKRVKSINKDIWIVGEVWGDGTPWLKGDQWDSVMNYQFRDAVLKFVTPAGPAKPSLFLNRLMTVYNSYAPQVSRNMMNLIGSHDTARVMTLCEGDASLAKLAAVIQFTWVGAPSVYYGDELGMAGGPDPDNRRGMAWESATPDNSMLSLYRKLVHLRKSSLVLQSGDPVPVLADDAKQVAAYARVLNGTADLIAVNRSAETQEIDLNLSTVAGLPTSVASVEFTDALSGTAYTPHKSILHLRLTPRSAVVLMPRLGISIHPSHHQLAPEGLAMAMSIHHAHKEPK